MTETTQEIDKRALGKEVVRWSDAHQADAVRKAEQYRALRPGQLTNAQLNNLQGLVEATPNYSEIRDYIKHQAEKANRAGPYQEDMYHYWQDMDKTLDGLREEANNILTGLVKLEEMTKRERQDAVDNLHRRLACEYVQHLVAHLLYLTPER